VLDGAGGVPPAPSAVHHALRRVRTPARLAGVGMFALWRTGRFWRRDTRLSEVSFWPTVSWANCRTVWPPTARRRCSAAIQSACTAPPTGTQSVYWNWTRSRSHRLRPPACAACWQWQGAGSSRAIHAPAVFHQHRARLVTGLATCPSTPKRPRPGQLRSGSYARSLCGLRTYWEMLRVAGCMATASQR
jgi:hypothetical protein